MDSVKFLLESERNRRIFIIGVLILLTLSILLAKILSKEPDELAGIDSCDITQNINQPVLLFFNANQGCDCAMVVYRNADRQIVEWKATNRHDIPVYRLNIEKCHEAARQLKIIMAPALLLLDENGTIRYRQNFPVSDEAPLDIPTFETKISELVKK